MDTNNYLSPAAKLELDVSNLCSRKLWDLLNQNSLLDWQQQRVIRELQTRRHYLDEIQSYRTQYR